MNSGAAAVCDACAAELPLMPDKACPCCALPVPADGLYCGRCLKKSPAFDASRAVWTYASPMREMILAFKHGQGFALADGFVSALHGLAAGMGADCVLPVPLHPLRMRERGFNPACELSRPLARRLGIEHLPDVLVRERHTAHLAGLRAQARRQTVRGAFRCTRDLAGRHVLVIDDVMTSGATLGEIARILRQRGAARVSNLVLARTLRDRGAG